MARLDCAELHDQYGWYSVDGYEQVDGALRRIELSERRYFVRVDAQIEALNKLGSFTKLSVDGRDPADGPDQQRGVAYLPPQRRETKRVVLGVAATPFAVAWDVVTFPIQAAGAIAIVVWWNIDPPKFLQFQTTKSGLEETDGTLLKAAKLEAQALTGSSPVALACPAGFVLLVSTPYVCEVMVTLASLTCMFMSADFAPHVPQR